MWSGNMSQKVFVSVASLHKDEKYFIHVGNPVCLTSELHSVAERSMALKEMKTCQQTGEQNNTFMKNKSKNSSELQKTQAETYLKS